MAQSFKEVARLRGNDKAFQDNFDKIDWGNNKANDTGPMVRTATVTEQEFEEWVSNYINSAMNYSTHTLHAFDHIKRKLFP